MINHCSVCNMQLTGVRKGQLIVVLTRIHKHARTRVKQTLFLISTAQRICFMPYSIFYNTFGKWRFNGVLALLVRDALVLRFICGKELERVMQVICMQLNVTLE